MTESGAADQESIVEAELDEEMYQAARPHLKAALECTLALGRSARDWCEFCLERFGDAVTPYLKRFLDDIEPHTLKIESWCESTRQATFGAEIAPDERERRVREAAYFRAERRGFIDGSPEKDWIEAEHEIERQLGEQAGIAAKGREVVSSLGELALNGFDGIRDALRSWMAHRAHSGNQQLD